MYEFAHSYMNDMSTFVIFTYLGGLIVGYLVFIVIKFFPEDKS